MDEEGAAELYELLQQFSLMVGRVDRWQWKGTGADGFSVRKAYEEIEEGRGRRPRIGMGIFPFYQIWKSFAPFKARVMAWRLVRNRYC